jgi:hypothetical protein
VTKVGFVGKQKIIANLLFHFVIFMKEERNGNQKCV